MNFGQNSALLTMYFSETVDATSLIVGGLTLVDSRTPTTSLTLSEDESEPVLVYRDGDVIDTTAVALELSTVDLNTLKANLNLATSKSITQQVFNEATGVVDDVTTVFSATTFLTIDADSIRDMADNGNNVVEDVNALEDQAYTEDTTAPELTAFSLDLSNALIYMVYSEPLDQTTYDPKQISIQGARNEADPSKIFALTGGIVSYTDLTELTIRIKNEDMNEIRLVLGNGADKSSTFVSAAALHATDTNENPLKPIEATDALEAAGFLPDQSPPLLSQFDFDLTNNTLLLTFSEPVHGPSFVPDRLTIRSKQCDATTLGCEDVKTVTLSTLSVAVQDPVDTLEVTIKIDVADMNKIKVLTTLGIDVSSTFISAASAFVDDLGGIPAVSILANDAVPATRVLPDTGKPVLQEFSINMNSGFIRLTFDEIIDASNVAYGAITIQNNDGSESRILTNGNLDTINSNVIAIGIIDADLNEIKRLEDLATPTSKTYVVLGQGAVHDMATTPNFNEEFSTGDSGYEPDGTSPKLTAFAVDMNAFTITLNFDETIDASTLEPKAFTVQSSRGESGYTLTGGETVPAADAADGLQVVLKITTADMNAIKQRENLFTTQDNAYLRHTTNTITAIKDMNGNLVDAIATDDAMKVTVTAFAADSANPRLTSFDLDMTAETITFVFPETMDVNPSNVDFTAITLMDSADGVDSGKYHPLQGGDVITQADSTTIKCKLKLADLNILKTKKIGREKSSTWLHIEAAAFRDQEGLAMFAQTSGSDAVQVDQYIADSTHPKLESFDLNMTAETLTLFFSETVSFPSIAVGEITLQSHAADPDAAVADDFHFRTLTVASMTTNTEDLPSVVIKIGEADVDEITRLTLLATAETNTFLSLTTAAFTDTAVVANPVAVVQFTDARRVVNYQEDTVRPILESFDIDFTTEKLLLKFSETVKVSSFFEDQIMIQDVEVWNGPGANPYAYGLTDVDALNADATSLELDISTADLNVIKKMRELANDKSTTYLSLTKFMITDMNNNPIMPIDQDSAQNAAKYEEDLVSPKLVEFDLSLNAGTHARGDCDGVSCYEGLLRLTFDETVMASSLTPGAITFQDALTRTTFHTLTGGRFSSDRADDGTVLELELQKDDLDSLKLNGVDVSANGLAISKETTWISITSSAVTDMNLQPVVQQLDGSAINAEAFEADETSPFLVLFDLNMNAADNEAILSLSFSETVDASTFDFTKITIQSSETSSAVSQTISNGGQHPSLTNHVTVYTNDDSTAITVTVTVIDVNGMKEQATLATSSSDAYISFPKELVKDMKGNFIQPVLSSGAQIVNKFVEDDTDPVLLHFDIDMDLGHLVLTFDEIVKRSTMSVPQVTLSSNVAGSADLVTYTLTGLDTPAEQIVDIPYKHVYNPDGAVSETSGGITADGFGAVITIHMTVVDLNEVKRLAMCTESKLTDELNLQADDCFITHTDAFVRDMRGNQVAVESGGFKARNYRTDQTKPVLTQFHSFSVDSGIVELHFDEPVRLSTFDATQITLQDYWKDRTFDSVLSVPFVSMVLDGGVPSAGVPALATTGSTDLILQLGKNDHNEVRVLDTICVSRGECWIRMTELVVTDMAGNRLDVRTNGDDSSSNSPTLFSEDDTRPQLIDMTVDMDQDDNTNGNITLTFDEPVDVATLDFDFIALHNKYSTETVELTNAITELHLDSMGTIAAGTSKEDGCLDAKTCTRVANGITVKFSLGSADMVLVKALRNLFTGTTDSYASLYNNQFECFVKDMAGNKVESHVPSSVDDGSGTMIYNNVQATSYKKDDTRPHFMEFTVEMELGQITLSFDEAVHTPSFTPKEITLQHEQNSCDNSGSNCASDSSDLTDFVTQNIFSHRLTGGEIVSVADDLRSFVFALNDADKRQLKLKEALWKTESATYLSMTEDAVTDVSDNKVVSKPLNDAMKTSDLAFDGAIPKVLEFDLNMNYTSTNAMLTVRFSDVVEIQNTIDVSKIVLQSESITDRDAGTAQVDGASAPTALWHRLTGTVSQDASTRTDAEHLCTSVDGYSLQLELSYDDTNAIKLKSGLAISKATTWIAIDEGMVLDDRQLKLEAIANAEAGLCK
jgi:hypothetical protein